MSRFMPAALVLATLLGAASLALPAPAAYADEVAGGQFDWGVKASFREYLTGPIAQGGWEVTDGATTVGGGEFRFHSGSGEFDPDRGAYHAAYSGGVRFVGHEREDGSYELALTIANPTVELAGGTGTLYMDVTSEAGRSDQVPFAVLSAAGVDVDGAGTATASGVAATLTSEGADAFAGYYAEGEQLDPISLTGDVTAEPDQPAEADTAREDPEPSPEASDPAPTPTALPSLDSEPPPVASPAAAQVDDSGSALVPVALGAVVVIVAAAVAGTVMLRRRHGTEATTPADPPDDPEQD